MYNTLIFFENVSGHRNISEGHNFGSWFLNDKVQDSQTLFIFNMEIILSYPQTCKKEKK